MAITTVGDLLTYSRQQLNSEKLNDVDTYAIWKDSELIHYINFAQQEFSRLTLCLPDYDSYTINVVATTKAYTYNPQIIEIFGGYLLTSLRRVQARSFKDVEKGWLLNIDRIEPAGGWEQETGIPKMIIPDLEAGKLVLWPNPVNNETLKLYVYKVAAAVDELTDNLEIDDQYRLGLNYKVMSLAYGKHDVDEAEDLQRSMLYAQKWQSFWQDAKKDYDLRFKRV